MRPLPLVALAAALTLSPVAFAGPGRPGAAAEKSDERSPAQGREMREKLLRRVHTQLVVELGSLLELDTAATIKLADRLGKFNDQRVALRLDTWDAMRQLRALARGEGTGDAAALAKRAAANRVKLAELDQRELDEVLQGLSADKAAKAAVFAAEFPRRIERMAHQMRGGGQGGGRGFGPGGFGPGGFGPGGDEE